MDAKTLPDAAEIRRVAKTRQKALSQRVGPLLEEFMRQAREKGVFRMKLPGNVIEAERDLLVSMGFEVHGNELSCAKGK